MRKRPLTWFQHDRHTQKSNIRPEDRPSFTAEDAPAETTRMGARRTAKDRQPDERAWSAHTSVPPRNAGTDLALYSALPAETGPTWAPDRLSVWPLEGGRYGIDAHYHGRTGLERAKGQGERLRKVGVFATVKSHEDGGLIRLGPLAHAATWLALEAFLGRPA